MKLRKDFIDTHLSKRTGIAEYHHNN